MSENHSSKQHPISTVRFGIGKELRLYTDELVVTGSEEDKELHIQQHRAKGVTQLQVSSRHGTRFAACWITGYHPNTRLGARSIRRRCSRRTVAKAIY